MDNLQIWEKVRAVPATAKKEIKGGRLSGMTDINPMWRLKTLTELFGPVGIGWHYTIEKQWLEDGPDGEMAAFTNVLLYIKHEGEWSAGIPGTGGSAFVAKEKSGLRMSDEAYKMSLTDALSVSCKALGIGADVYWDKDSTKYSPQRAPASTEKRDNKPEVQTPSEAKLPASKPKLDRIRELLTGSKLAEAQVAQIYKVKTLEDLSDDQAIEAIAKLESMRGAA